MARPSFRLSSNLTWIVCWKMNGERLVNYCITWCCQWIRYKYRPCILFSHCQGFRFKKGLLFLDSLNKTYDKMCPSIDRVCIQIIAKLLRNLDTVALEIQLHFPLRLVRPPCVLSISFFNEIAIRLNLLLLSDNRFYFQIPKYATDSEILGTMFSATFICDLIKTSRITFQYTTVTITIIAKRYSITPCFRF